MDAALTAPPLFAQLLGPAFAALPAPVSALHLAQGPRRYRGRVEVARGSGLLSRLLAAATRLPPAGAGPLRVDIDARPQGERWTRHVGGRAMPSRLWRDGDLLCERLGPVRFGFRLRAAEGAIHWQVVQARVLGLPLPAAWFAGVGARESADGARYCFDVWAAMPLAGPLVHYRGWLAVDDCVD